MPFSENGMAKCDHFGTLLSVSWKSPGKFVRLDL